MMNIWTITTEAEKAHEIKQVAECKAALQTLDRLTRKERLSAVELIELCRARSIAKYAKLLGI